MIDLDLNKAREEIERRKARLVLVQIPEGLKSRTTEIIDKLQGKETEVIVLMDPCYGACDLAITQMRKLKADLVLHLGHSKITESRNAIYMPLHYRLDGKRFAVLAGKIIKELKKRKIKKVALATTIQYVNYLQKLKKSLEEGEIKAVIGEGSAGIAAAGQVLGCNYSSVRGILPSVEGVVFLGDGLFHPLGITFITEKPVVFANAHSGKIVDLEKERNLLMKRRFAAIAMAKEAKSFGIIISTKPGQRRKEIAMRLKNMVEFYSKKAYLFASDFIKAEYYLGAEVDCFVNTACPRIAVDDSSNWKKPILNPTELEIALGKKKWEHFKLDELD